MKTISVEELRNIQMDILNIIDSFCKDNDIVYFLCGGTLIGAIRHKGFIPWDDDIDIMMKRADYDRFVKEFPDTFTCHANKYRLYAFEKDGTFPYPYAKVANDNTVFVEELNNSFPMGVNVDVFPIDNVPDCTNVQHQMYRRCRFLTNILTLKRLPILRRRGFLKNTILIISQFILCVISVKFIISSIIKNATKYKSEKTNYIGCVVWGYGAREIMNAKCLSSSVPYEFEGKEFPVPIGFNEYLSNLYGDYMQLPPEDKRVSHHWFEAWWKA